jgi:hypothetical protein
LNVSQPAVWYPFSSISKNRANTFRPEYSRPLAALRGQANPEENGFSQGTTPASREATSLAVTLA